MIIANPFTGQVLNVNPKGCNQYSGPNCADQGIYPALVRDPGDPRLSRLPHFLQGELPRMARIAARLCEADPKVCYDKVAEATRDAELDDDVVFVDRPDRTKYQRPYFDHVVLQKKSGELVDTYADRRVSKKHTGKKLSLEYGHGPIEAPGGEWEESYRMPVKKFREIIGLD